MPIFEYRCASCGREFEVLVLRRGDEPALACPACASAAVSRRMSRPAAPRTGVGRGGSGSPPPGCGPVG